MHACVVPITAASSKITILRSLSAHLLSVFKAATCPSVLRPILYHRICVVWMETVSMRSNPAESEYAMQAIMRDE